MTIAGTLGASGMRRTPVTITACALAALAAAGAACASPVFVVTGRGWGHGVGMSQWGAHGYARHGYRYERILAHYYPGTRLGPAPAVRVRVLLARRRKGIRVGSKRAFRLVDGHGRAFVLPGGPLRVRPGLILKIRGKRLRLAGPLRFRPGSRPLRLERVPYRGEIVVRARGGRLSAVNELELERYLRGVVPWEMPHEWHGEALKAQAVVARTYALATRKPGRIYDLFDDARSQVYGGIRAERAETNRAIAATAGRALWWGDELAVTFYHSTSGGRTAAVWDAWPGARRLPYLRAVWDRYGRDSPYHRWQPLVLSARQLARRLQAPGPRDVLVTRNRSGCAASLRLRTETGMRRLPAHVFQRAFRLRSSCFEVGVLSLAPTPRVARGAPVLAAIARNVRGAVLERREDGRWRAVRRVRAPRWGRFELRVPGAPALYRLAAGSAATPPIAVGTSG